MMTNQIFEIVDYKTGIDDSGVNYLDPADAFKVLQNGFVYRQELKSRLGFSMFSTGRLSDGSRVMGIFEHILPNNTTECLAITKEFLYSYNTGTNTFDQIPNVMSAPAGGFGISSNDEYVSGTTYPFPDGTQRFVFTGKGMSDIYMYDGTDVRSFTLDNANYQAPAAGTLRNAFHIIWFGERLNLICPTINAIFYPQGVLYSGIRDSSGNGDKFNAVGSGQINLDTYNYINGATINGNVLELMLNRSNWALEKTRDAFNPYFPRRIPCVVGTDASFGFATWGDEVKSLGKTGAVSSDARQALRFDNKIPYFTANEIDATEFQTTYGGFDRINGQFLYSYISSGSDNTTQDKVLVYNYEEKTWAINDMRFSVFGQTVLGQELTWDDIYEVNHPSWGEWDTTEEIWNQIGVTAEQQKTLAGDDNGIIYQLNQDFDDYYSAISNISQAASAVITIGDTSYQVGDTVTFEDVEGMTEINGRTAIVTAVNSLTEIVVNIDTTLFTAYTSGGHVSKPISFKAITSPFNPYRSEGRRVYVSHIEFLLDVTGGGVYVDVYQDEEESPFIRDVLIQPSLDTTKARQYITLCVNNEANFMSFALKQESASDQVIITSMRIHARQGGFTAT